MQKEEILKLFESFNKLSVLIIGDVMVDSYLFGKVDRISPEAPVPVVSVNKRENRLGGAANVALNIKAMGAKPILCSVIGNDLKGDEFIDLLKDQGMETGGIIQSSDRITTTKFRVIGNKVQMLRVDEETDKELNAEDKETLLSHFLKIIENEKIDVIVFQDYDKGVISAEIISAVVDKARQLSIPIAVDPKKKNFNSYKNVTLFKPNLKELKEGLNVEFENSDDEALKNAVIKLKNELRSGIILLTLSEYGIFIDYGAKGGTETHVIPSHVRSIADVSGAGDSVISVAALCLAIKTDPLVLASVSNLAGGLVCEKIGVVPVDKERLMFEMMNLKLD